MISRRSLLAGVAAALPAAAPPAIAALLTEYRPASHADVWVTALLEGYDDGQPRTPALRIASMYTDQQPANDMSRAVAAKHGVPIAPTIHQALTLGTTRLAVDGILLMAEHGDYPVNEKGQKLYPRFEFFRQVVDTFRKTGKAVPVFCDKHLSYEWDKAKWMYDQARAIGFPLMAGSSLPFTWRQPPLELPLGSRVEEAVVASYGGKESYGFHALETLQCMVERRAGGETGIAAVECLEGAPVWDWTARNLWAKRLQDAALARVDGRKPGAMEDYVRSPILFLLEYVDGLRAAVYLLNGYLSDWTFAARIRGRSEPVSTKFWTRMVKPWSHAHGLTHQLEQFYLRRRPSFPVERTLLTTGALAALMERGRVETPHLRFSYEPPKDSLFNRGRIPPPG
jgi:hypothetical protein